MTAFPFRHPDFHLNITINDDQFEELHVYLRVLMLKIGNVVVEVIDMLVKLVHDDCDMVGSTARG